MKRRRKKKTGDEKERQPHLKFCRLVHRVRDAGAEHLEPPDAGGIVHHDPGTTMNATQQGGERWIHQERKGRGEKGRKRVQTTRKRTGSWQR